MFNSLVMLILSLVFFAFVLYHYFRVTPEDFSRLADKEDTEALRRAMGKDEEK